MRVLRPATGVSQKDGEAGDWEHCGPACADSVCIDAGLPRPLVDVVTWMKAHGMNPDYGTPAQWIVVYLIACGIPCHRVFGDGAIDAALDRGHRLIWLVWSDGRGNLNGSRHTRHWVEIWGHDGAGFYVENPLGDPVFGSNHVYTEQQIIGNSCGEGIEIDLVLPGDQPPPAPPTIEDDMDPVKCPNPYGGTDVLTILPDHTLLYEHLGTANIADYNQLLPGGGLWRTVTAFEWVTTDILRVSGAWMDNRAGHQDNNRGVWQMPVQDRPAPAPGGK